MLLRNFIFSIFIFLFMANAMATDTLYYSSTDNTVRALNVLTGSEVATVTGFAGAAVGAAREIAYDPVTGLLWYSATDNVIHSINVNTSVAGPSISNVPGAAVGADRHLFIDYKRRTLLVPDTSGNIQIYDLSTQANTGSIPSTFFTDGNVGVFRHLASDIRRGTIWYAATDGSFREMDPDTVTNTGRQISFSEQIGADPGAFRHFVIDPDRDLLLYMVTDDSVAAVNLTTLTRDDSFTVSSAAFNGASVGAGRVITYDNLGTRTVSGYSATTQQLTLPVVIVGSNLFSAVLSYDGQQLTLVSSTLLPASQSSVPDSASFDSSTGQVTIPRVTVGVNEFSAVLQRQGTTGFVFTVLSLTPI